MKGHNNMKYIYSNCFNKNEYWHMDKYCARFSDAFNGIGSYKNIIR